MDKKIIVVGHVDHGKTTLTAAIESVLEKQRGVIISSKPPKQIEKTDGNGNTYLVDNPDYLDDEGKFRKHRNPMTHLKPKKKKRK